MAEIHPTAVVDPAAELAEDVVIGPMAVVGADVRIGAGTVVIGQAWIEGPTTIGAGNRLYPGVRLGLAPQSVAFDPAEPGEGLVIGDDNVLREGVTVHRAMTDEGPTRIGSGCMLMTNSHVGHDARLADRCILASGALVGGHAVLEDRVNAGGNATIHQFVRIGEGAMLSGSVGTGLDVPPWFMLTGVNLSGAVNLIGMRRSGMDRADVDQVRWIHRLATREATIPKLLLPRLRERADVPIVARYLAWFEASTRGWVTTRGRAARGTA